MDRLIFVKKLNEVNYLNDLNKMIMSFCFMSINKLINILINW